MTREKIIKAIEEEMGYYDMPECEPNITLSGKKICDLVNLCKSLMVENDILDKSAHERGIEIIRLNKMIRSHKND